MNIEDMSREELIAQLEAQESGETGDAQVITVEHGGHTVEVDAKKLQSWEAFKLVHATDTADGTQRVMCALDLIEYLTGINEKEIVGMCGGADATTVGVVVLVDKIIKACYPKN